MFASCKYAADFAAQIVKRRFENGSPWVEDYRPIFRERVELRPHCFAHTTLEAIALNGISERARDGKAEARWDGRAIEAQAEGGEIAAGHADTGLIDVAELSGPDNAP